MNSCHDCEYVLEKFVDVDEEEVRKIIANLPDKTSPLDPFPTWLLKRCVDTLLPVITSIINNSFRSHLCFLSTAE